MQLYISLGIRNAAGGQLQERVFTGQNVCNWVYYGETCIGSCFQSGCSTRCINCRPRAYCSNPDEPNACDYFTGSTVCQFALTKDWTNVSSCTPSSPGCSSGAVRRECRTI
jgi:hypothetical protein